MIEVLKSRSDSALIDIIIVGSACILFALALKPEANQKLMTPFSFRASRDLKSRKNSHGRVGQKSSEKIFENFIQFSKTFNGNF